MRAQEQVVAEGVTPERAVELCSTPEATMATLVSMVRELDEILDLI